MAQTLHNPLKETSLRDQLAGRLSKSDILTLQSQCLYEARSEELYQLLFDTDTRIASNAAWICTHWDKRYTEWPEQKQAQLIERLIHTSHATLRRLLLTLLYRQRHLPLRIDFLNFCLQGMLACQGPNSIRALCIKLAYAQCVQEPDLLKEFRQTLDIMKYDSLPPSVCSVRKHAFQAIEKKKTSI